MKKVAKVLHKPSFAPVWETPTRPPNIKCRVSHFFFTGSLKKRAVCAHITCRKSMSTGGIFVLSTARTNTENLKQIFPEKDLSGRSPPVHIHVSLSCIYIFPPSICVFCCRKNVDRDWVCINRSQANECGNWDWGHAIPRKGIHKWDFRCSERIRTLNTD